MPLPIVTAQTRQQRYVGDTRSDMWIARETGIPRSTLGYVRRGERRLPERYRSQIRNLYQREGYRRMREVGVSRAQARRFSWYTPAKVREVTETVKKLVADLTSKRVINMIGHPDSEYVPADYESLFVEQYQYVRDAFRESPKPYESWQDYEESFG